MCIYRKQSHHILTATLGDEDMGISCTTVSTILVFIWEVIIKNKSGGQMPRIFQEKFWNDIIDVNTLKSVKHFTHLRCHCVCSGGSSIILLLCFHFLVLGIEPGVLCYWATTQPYLFIYWTQGLAKLPRLTSIPVPASWIAGITVRCHCISLPFLV